MYQLSACSMNRFLLLLLVLLTGCASGSFLGEPIQKQREIAGSDATDELAQLNASMGSGRFLVVLAYGEERRAERVTIGTSEIGFRPSGGSYDRYAPLVNVVRVDRITGDGSGGGEWVGALPGLGIIGASIVVGVRCSSGDSTCGGLALLGGLGGIVVASVGALVGAGLGDAGTGDQYQTIYDGPFEPRPYQPLPSPRSPEPTERCAPFC